MEEFQGVSRIATAQQGYFDGRSAEERGQTL
jgi:hypothetical protein